MPFDPDTTPEHTGTGKSGTKPLVARMGTKGMPGGAFEAVVVVA
jgi:hypothetical protein